MRLLAVLRVAGLGVQILSSVTRPDAEEIPLIQTQFVFQQRADPSTSDKAQGQAKPAEQNVTGKAVDKDNNPVRNKQLRFEGKTKTYSVYTDGTGSFTFACVPGIFEVSVVGSSKKTTAKVEESRLLPSPLVLSLE